MLFLIVMNPRALGESEADGRLRPRPELAGGKGGGGGTASRSPADKPEEAGRNLLGSRELCGRICSGTKGKLARRPEKQRALFQKAKKAKELTETTSV